MPGVLPRHVQTPLLTPASSSKHAPVVPPLVPRVSAQCSTDGIAPHSKAEKEREEERHTAQARLHFSLEPFCEPPYPHSTLLWYLMSSMQTAVAAFGDLPIPCDLPHRCSPNAAQKTALSDSPPVLTLTTWYSACWLVTDRG